jgi:hypothetical protein
MASSVTGEMFTQEQYEALTPQRREELKVVGLSEQESQELQGMNRKDRRVWLKANKKFKKPTHNKSGTLTGEKIGLASDKQIVRKDTNIRKGKS